MRIGMLVLVLGFAVGCAPSEDEIRKEFGDFVSEHNSCERDADCELIMPGCPLGCSVPVNASAADAAMKLASELIDDYESAGRACEYGCFATCGARCTERVCTVIEWAECAPAQ